MPNDFFGDHACNECPEVFDHAWHAPPSGGKKLFFACLEHREAVYADVCNAWNEWRSAFEEGGFIGTDPDPYGDYRHGEGPEWDNEAHMRSELDLDLCEEDE